MSKCAHTADVAPGNSHVAPRMPGDGLLYEDYFIVNGGAVIYSYASGQATLFLKAFDILPKEDQTQRASGPSVDSGKSVENSFEPLHDPSSSLLPVGEFTSTSAWASLQRNSMNFHEAAADEDVFRARIGESADHAGLPVTRMMDDRPGLPVNSPKVDIQSEEDANSQPISIGKCPERMPTL